MQSEIEELTSFFDLAPVSYFILDPNGLIKNTNINGVNMLGDTKEELIEKPLSAFLSNQLWQDSFHRNKINIINTKQQQRLECEFRKKDGTVFFALMEINIVKDEQNNLKYLLTTIIDITDKKEMEQNFESALAKEKELGELKSRFITIASHEFRTPLASIVLSTELLEKHYEHDNIDGEKRKRHYQKIRTAVSRLKEILMDFLSLEEVETGKIKNNPETFNIVNYINHFIEEVRSYNGIHQVKYEHIGKYTDVLLDKKLLNTCLTNLFINAFKYSPNGGTVSIISEQKKQGAFSFIIKDQGIGIPEQEKPYIFKPFFRAKNAENIQGTGLGLEITQKLINIMGGSISFDSKENEGTTFYLKFNKN